MIYSTEEVYSLSHTPRFYAYDKDSFFRDEFCASCFGYHRQIWSDDLHELITYFVNSNWSDPCICES